MLPAQGVAQRNHLSLAHQVVNNVKSCSLFTLFTTYSRNKRKEQEGTNLGSPTCLLFAHRIPPCTGKGKAGWEAI
jgi:hypothetical protein